MTVIEYLIKCGFAPMDDALEYPVYRFQYEGEWFYMDTNLVYWRNMTLDHFFNKLLKDLSHDGLRGYLFSKRRSVFIDEILLDL